MNEREKLLSFLFDREDLKVRNVKFFRGNAENLTAEQMCKTAREVLEETLQNIDCLEDAPPICT